MLAAVLDGFADLGFVRPERDFDFEAFDVDYLCGSALELCIGSCIGYY